MISDSNTIYSIMKNQMKSKTTTDCLDRRELVFFPSLHGGGMSEEKACSVRSKMPYPSSFSRIGIGRRSLCFELGLLIFFMIWRSVVADAEEGAPYPWVKEGPAVPEFTIKAITAYPSLLIDPADIPEVKRRFEAAPGHPPAIPKRIVDPALYASDATPKDMDPALYALLYGEEAAKRKATGDFMAKVRQVYTKDGKYGFGMKNPLSEIRRTGELLYTYDVIVSFGFLTPQEIQEYKDDVVRTVGYFIGNDPARLPCKATPNPSGTEFPTGFAVSAGNRWTDQYIIAGLAGLTFPDLPQAKAWVEYAIQQTEFQLAAGDMDGAWIEVPRYHDWTMLLFSGWMAALKHRTGVDLYNNPHLKAMADWPVRFSSPLVRFPQITELHSNGIPCTPAWGDSDYGNHFAVCAMFGTAYAQSDPEFSKRLMWMWRRAGSPFLNSWQFRLISPMLVDPLLPDAPQKLGSAFCKRLGYIALRSGFDTPEETWVTMRAGEAHNHRRNDLGSIDIFSDGIPLACGAQSGPYHEPELEWNNRFVGANNDVAFVGHDSHAKTKEANPYVDIPDLQSVTSGKALAFFTSPTVDYAVADCSRPQSRNVSAGDAFKWVRHVALVKQPDYLLVWDQCDSAMASKWFLHSTATNFIWGEGLITAKTAYGADLDIHVLSPSSKLTPNMKEGPFGSWTYADLEHRKQNADSYPFTLLKYFTLDAPPKADYVTVLQPRKSGDLQLAATLVSQTKNGSVVRVNLAGRTDLITLTPHGGTYQRGDAPLVTMPMSLPGDVEAGYNISAVRATTANEHAISQQH